MTLKRCGAICRQVADSAIDSTVHLCGIDLNPETTTPVYQCLYQEILSPDDLLQKQSVVERFDLAVLLKLTEVMQTNQKLLDFTVRHITYLLADQKSEHFLLSFFSQKQIRSISLDNDRYLLIKTTKGGSL